MIRYIISIKSDSGYIRNNQEITIKYVEYFEKKIHPIDVSILRNNVILSAIYSKYSIHTLLNMNDGRYKINKYQRVFTKSNSYTTLFHHKYVKNFLPMILFLFDWNMHVIICINTIIKVECIHCQSILGM